MKLIKTNTKNNTHPQPLLNYFPSSQTDHRWHFKVSVAANHYWLKLALSPKLAALSNHLLFPDQKQKRHFPAPQTAPVGPCFSLVWCISRKKKKPLYHKTDVNYCTRKGVPFPVLPPLFARSPWDDTDTDIENGWVKNPEVCDRDERKLPASISSSEPKPWWHSTRSTRSSFSLQVSVGMFLRIRYWRRSLTFNLMSCGRWNAVSCSKWQVEHLLRFSCETEQTEQKSFLQSQHTC